MERILRKLDDARRHLERQLTWGRLFHAISYARSSLWLVPLFAIVLVVIVAPVLRWIDVTFELNLSPLRVAGATTLYQTTITLTLSFLVFTFGSLLVAIQIAGGQLTPRIIATTLLRDNVVRFSVGLFTFSLIFSVIALDRLEGRVHELVALVTTVLALACMVTFLFLIDYAARLLRPVTILSRVGAEGATVIESVYREHAGEGADEATALVLPPGEPRIVRHAGASAIVLAVDLVTLVREARRGGGVVELIPHVGDFVASDEPLFKLYGGLVNTGDRIWQEAVAFGAERTMEQDPLFAFRILVDIGIKALSPAINDPTTGVLALDQIHRLLRLVGRKRLRGDVIADAAGIGRVVYRTPNWEDFVNLACHEIRRYGADNVQIARRLRAMLDNLIRTLPAHRRLALSQERRSLDQAIEGLYPIAADLALARIADSQGLGAAVDVVKGEGARESRD